MSEAARVGGLSLRSPRRRRSADERRLIVEETLEAGSSVARVAMKHGVNANQVFKWRRLYESGRLGPRAPRDIQLLPVRVAEEQEISRAEDVDAAPAVRSASMHIELPGSVRIRLEGNVDAAMVRAVLKSLLSGHVFVFRGRRGDIVKVLWFDGDGLCLLAKRLERGRFVWPQASTGTVSLTRAQLSMLLEGIDWRAPVRTAERVMSV